MEFLILLFWTSADNCPGLRDFYHFSSPQNHFQVQHVPIFSWIEWPPSPSPTAFFHLSIHPFQAIKEKIRDQSEELVREVRSQVEDLCLEVDQTSAKERAKLLRTVDELSRQLERITSSCNVVKDLLGKAAAYDVSTLREDVLYSLETPREILDLPSVPR